MQARWATSITKIEPNTVEIAGYPLSEIISGKGLPETACLLLTGEFPDHQHLAQLREISLNAASLPPPGIEFPKNQHLTKRLVTCLLQDDTLATYSPAGKYPTLERTMFCMGRMARYVSSTLGNEKALSQVDGQQPFSHFLARALTGRQDLTGDQARLLEALVVATVDHGLTPPSAQVSILAASVRAPYEVAIAQALSTITDVHGGAGTRAADFFLNSLKMAQDNRVELSDAMGRVMEGFIRDGKRIQGLGHRIHTVDPRCEVLLTLAEQKGIAAQCVQASRMAPSVFSRLTGTALPINVDGVIGAIIADMDLDLRLATAVFILGRIAGLSAHYFEEIASFPEMRRIDFSQAVYEGPPARAVSP